MFWIGFGLTIAFIFLYMCAGFITTLNQESKIDGIYDNAVFRGMMLIWPFIFVRGVLRVGRKTLDSMVKTKTFAVKDAWKAIK